MKRIKKMNWRPDLPDHRDHIYAVEATVKFPDHVDLRPFCSAVEDQGDIGSCTGQAISGAIELLDKRKENGVWIDISRLFIYYNERKYIGKIREDSGAYIRDGIKSVAKIGAAKETLWPYDVTKYKLRPPKAAYTDASNRKFTSYKRIVDLNSMLGCLAEGFPFVFGFTCYESFLSDEVAKSGVLNMPTKDESEQGGHAVLAVGYSQPDKRFIVRNSWGPNWGDAGYFTIPFDYLTNRDLSDDMWTIRG